MGTIDKAPRLVLRVLLSVTLAIGMVPSAAFAEAIDEQHAPSEPIDSPDASLGQEDASAPVASTEEDSPQKSGEMADKELSSGQNGSEDKLDAAEENADQADGTSVLPEGFSIADENESPEDSATDEASDEDETTDLGGAYMLGFLDGQVRYLATGSAVELEHGILYVKDNPSNNGQCWELYEGEDYELARFEDTAGAVLDSAPSEPGSYKAIYRGIGKYHGEREYEFSIFDSYDIASYEPNPYIDWEVVGTESASSPQVHMVFNRKLSGRENDYWGDDNRVDVGLRQGVDYQIIGYSGLAQGESPSNAGWYDVIIEGIGNYQGTAICSLQLFSKKLDFVDNYHGASVQTDYDWTGSPVELEYTFYFGPYLSPVEGRDYVLVCYDENGNELSEPPTDACNFSYGPRAIEGGRCTGERAKDVSAIVHDYRCDLSDESKFEYTQNNDGVMYIGDGWEPYSVPYSFSGYYGDDWYIGDMVGLEPGVDFEYVFYDSDGNELSGYPTSEGVYSFKLVAIPGSQCRGETDAKFSVTVSDKHCISDSYWNSVWVGGNALYSDDAGLSCFYFGNESGFVEPPVSVSSRPNRDAPPFAQLEEGKDYVVSYSRNEASPSADQVATVTITGVGDYYGEATRQFKVLSKIDLGAFAPSAYGEISSGIESYPVYPSYAGGETPRFFTTGSPVKPQVSYTLRNSSGAGLTLGTSSGFVISYVDSEGHPVEPVRAGDYKAILTATDEGILSGRTEVSFSLVDTKDISQIRNIAYGGLIFAISGEGNVYGSSSRDEADGSWIYAINRCLEDSQIFGLKGLVDSGRNLIEGVDYVLSVVRDGVYQYLTIDGIGKYTGSVRSTVYGQTKQEFFDAVDIGINRTVRGWVYNPSVRDAVYATSAGAFEGPLIDCDQMVQGVDFEAAGIVDAKGNELKSADGNNAFVKIVGIGSYEGCQRLIPVEVYKGWQGVDLSEPGSCGLSVRDSVYDGKSGITYALKSALSNVALKVYGQNTILHDGDGITIKATLNQETGLTNISASAWDGSDMKGSYSQDYQVVDSLSLNQMAARVVVATGPRQSIACELKDDGSFEIPSGTWFYHGFSYAPSLAISTNYSGYIDSSCYSVEWYDASGEKTDGIIGPGAYSIRVVGKDGWEGSLIGSVSVSDAANIALDDVAVSIDGRSGYLDNIVVPLQNGAAKPQVRLRYFDYELIEGRDYEVSYADNDSEGSATVTVSAIEGSGFTGQKTWTFAVAKQVNIVDAGFSLAAPDDDGYLRCDGKCYSYWANTNVTSSLENGTACPDIAVLAIGDRRNGSTDNMVALDPSCYDVVYGNNEEAGTAWVQVTGKNGYTGTLAANYRVVDYSSVPFVATAKAQETISQNMSTLTCSFTGASDNGIEYEWLGSADQGKTWFHSGCVGQGTSELRVASNEGNASLRFRCKVTDARGRTAYTDPVSIVVLPRLTVDIAAGNPVDGKSTLSATVGNALDYGVSYEWQLSEDGNHWFKSGCEGQGTNELKVPANAGNAKLQFRCVVMTADGRSAASSNTRISLGDPLTVSVSASDPVKGKSTLSAEVGNAGDYAVSYVWQFSSDGEKWYKSGCDGQGTADLHVVASSGNAGLWFRCIASTVDGRLVTSDPARISLGQPLLVTVSAADPVNGKSALSAKVENANGSRLSYEWQLSTDSVRWFRSGCEGQGTSTLKVVANEGNGALRFRCVVTASDGRSTISDGIAISLNKPLGAFVAADSPVGGFSALTVNVLNLEGSSASYLWQGSADGGATWFTSGCKGQGTAQLYVVANKGNAGLKFRCVVTASDGRVAATNPVAILLS